MIYLIGGNGFVGGGYKRLFEQLNVPFQIITRDNAKAFKGTSCALLINANGNSKKFMASRDPLWEFEASVTSVAKSLEWFKADRYIFLSSGDVYPQTHSPAVTNEDQVIDVTRLSRYGLHKHMAEQLVRGVHPDHLIVRMGGFVGPGLSKNAIFDMMTGGDLWLSLDSQLQFIHTDKAAEIVYAISQKTDIKNEIVNLGARGMICLREIYEACGSTSAIKEGAQHVTYELSLDKLERIYGESLPTSRETVLHFLKEK